MLMLVSLGSLDLVNETGEQEGISKVNSLWAIGRLSLIPVRACESATVISLRLAG